MKKIFCFLMLAALCVACNTQSSKEEFVCPSNLDDVEFFYLDLKEKLLHVNPNCSCNKCSYIENTQSNLRYYNNVLCTSCISPELARQIIKGKD